MPDLRLALGTEESTALKEKERREKNPNQPTNQRNKNKLHFSLSSAEEQMLYC